MVGGVPPTAICVRDVDVQCVLQFTLIHAASCALHRRASRVIHRIELYSFCFEGRTGGQRPPHPHAPLCREARSVDELRVPAAEAESTRQIPTKFATADAPSPVKQRRPVPLESGERPLLLLLDDPPKTGDGRSRGTGLGRPWTFCAFEGQRHLNRTALHFRETSPPLSPSSMPREKGPDGGGEGSESPSASVDLQNG